MKISVNIERKNPEDRRSIREVSSAMGRKTTSAARKSKTKVANAGRLVATKASNAKTHVVEATKMRFGRNTTEADCLEEIYDWANVKMRKANIEDTLVNKFYFLQGLKTAWDEDPDEEGKQAYVDALDNELARLKMALVSQGIEEDQ